MAKQKRPAHIHKYHKIPSKFHNVWSCARPDCSHFMPTHLEHLLMGKQTICWNCGKTAVFDETNFEMNNPICIECQFGQIEITEPESKIIESKTDWTKPSNEELPSVEDLISTLNSKLTH